MRFIIHCFSFKKFVYLFLHFWLCWVFVVVHGLSLVTASRGHPSLKYTSFLLQWLLLWWSTGCRHVNSGFLVHGLSCPVSCENLLDLGSKSPSPLGPQTWDQTCVTFIGRWILNYWATKEVPWEFLKLTVVKIFKGY